MLQLDVHGYIYVSQMATHFANKTFNNSGGLAFPQYGRHVKIVIVRT